MALLKYRDYDPYVLKFLNEQIEPVHKKCIWEGVAKLTNTSQEDLQIIKTGIRNGYSKFYDKVDWSLTYLKQAELIENVDRAIYQITDSGKLFLAKNPEFTFKIVKEETPFLANRKSSSVKKENDVESVEDNNNQDVEQSVGDYYESVEFDILDRLKNLGTHTVDKGTQFEDICLDLLETMGYGNKERTGGSGDRGIDGFLTTDKFGFERIGVQCKCYTDGKINDDQITKFAHGLKNVNGLNKGIFITTTDYTPSAKKVVEELKDIKIILINGVKLAQFMREYKIGVEVIETNFVYDIVIGEDN